MLQIGSVIDGKYKILNEIGHGGMSVVYLAMNERANKQWAIKEVRKDGVQNFDVVKQSLVAETDMLKKLNHPNLPSIIDVIDTEGTFLIVMDYIEGNALSKALKEQGAQSQDDVIEWAKQLCDVLGYLHSRKPPIIYRDMKPSNVMLKPDGKVMLIDFGTAREFKSTSVEDTKCLGTQGYAAPEQYGGQGQTDARTDIYCLGATMYHLITGHNPAQPPYEMYPIRQWNPMLSSGLEEIILKCTQKNPADRYQSCAELMYALEHYQENDEVARIARKKKWTVFWAAASVAIVAGIAASGFAIAENNVKTSTYEVYLEDASTLELKDPEQCVEYYKNAIRLNPSRGEAYEELLNYFLWINNDSENDGGVVMCSISESEDDVLREVTGLNEDNNERTNEDYLRSNEDAYNKFAYDLGIAYYYSLESNAKENRAKKWLGVAASADVSDELNERNIQRAKNLYNICEYYDSLGVRNQAGDSQVSYQDYWSDLNSILRSEEEVSNNNTNVLLIYRKVSSEIFGKADHFLGAGVTKTEMSDQLAHIENGLDYITPIQGSANEEYESELKEIVETNLEQARKKLEVINNSQSDKRNSSEVERSDD